MYYLEYCLCTIRVFIMMLLLILSIVLIKCMIMNENVSLICCFFVYGFENNYCHSFWLYIECVWRGSLWFSVFGGVPYGLVCLAGFPMV